MEVLKLKNIIFLGSTNIIEWYDFLLVAYFAPFLAIHFFPMNGQDASHGILSVLLIFGVGFIFRPIGALYLGRMSKHYGRFKIVVLTVLVPI